MIFIHWQLPRYFYLGNCQGKMLCNLFLPWQYYEATFQANDDWKTIEIPFKNFKKSNFYQPSSVSSIDIETIGVVAIGRDFKANIDLAFIELY